MIKIEYVLALEDRQPIEIQSIPKGSRLSDALPYFALDREARSLIDSPQYGIFNQVVELDYCLQDGDRIEVYRPLIIDPKEARKIRAERNQTNISSAQITELR